MSDGIDRIILHWTGGGPRASDADLGAYHYIVEQTGRIVPGDHAPAHNAAPLGNVYAAHTRGYNTGSLGVAFAGMFDARERPFSPGPWPLTEGQIEAGCAFVARELASRGLPCTVETCFTHAEAAMEPHHRPQAGKWDINWLPGMAEPVDPRTTGDMLREMIRAVMPSPPVLTEAEYWRMVQQGLTGLGYNVGPIDGIPGPKTRGGMRAALFRLRRN